MVEDARTKLMNPISTFMKAILGQVERLKKKIFLIEKDLAKLNLNNPKRYAPEERAKATWLCAKGSLLSSGPKVGLLGTKGHSRTMGPIPTLPSLPLCCSAPQSSSKPLRGERST